MDCVKTVCELNACTGCNACISKCPKEAINIKDDISSYNAIINDSLCINCGLCHKVCPNNSLAKLNKPIKWYEGYSNEFRKDSSSGAVAYSLMYYFIKDGGYVASCLFKDGQFLFNITNNINDIRKYIGSKYVKSNPIGIHKKVLDLLNKSEKVLFIGLPCQVAGLKNYVGNKDNNLYTVDLICHGTPSSKLLDKFLLENNIDIKEIKDIKFRSKSSFRLEEKKDDEYKCLNYPRVGDYYTNAFLSSLDYTENCYCCRYATINRVSDITIGDSWGSKLDDEEKGKGISLMLAQSQKGIDLLNNSNLVLLDVDLDEAIKANHQLEHPSIKTNKTDIFFFNIDKGFTYAYRKSNIKDYYKMKLKEILIKLHILGGGQR